MRRNTREYVVLWDGATITLDIYRQWKPESRVVEVKMKQMIEKQGVVKLDKDEEKKTKKTSTFQFGDFDYFCCHRRKVK